MQTNIPSIKINLLAILVFFSINNQAQTLTDYEGNVYNTVVIGTQVWMGENLKVAHYNNGNSIPNVTDSTAWDNLTTGAYCWYNNDSSTYENPYGKLYNWYAVQTGNLCPSGWHVPTYPELTALANYLGGENIAGGKLKEAGTEHWNSPNTGATNETGFTALPGGARTDNGAFFSSGMNGILLSSTEAYSGFAWHRGLSYNNSNLGPGYGPMKYGFSVRCICNFPVQTDEKTHHERIQIYPNPATDKVYITCCDTQDLKMQMYDLIGQPILQSEFKRQINSIDVSWLSKGIYIIKIYGSNWTIQYKLTKE